MNTKRIEKLEKKAYILRLEKKHAQDMFEYCVDEKLYRAIQAYGDAIVKVDCKLEKIQKKFEKLEKRNRSRKNKSINKEEVKA